MSAKEKPVFSRLKLNGNTYEALCHPHKIREFREKKCGLDDVVLDRENVFKNNGKERWAKKELEAAFETSNITEILTRIVEKGAAQITTEEVREDVEKKRREVIHYLSSKYVDPKSGRGIPVTRIESALDQIKGVTFDPKRSAADHANELLRKIQDTGLGMKKLEIEATVTVAHALQGPSQAVLKKMCTVQGMSHSAAGVVFSIGLNPADMEELQKELGKVTKGEYAFDLVESTPAPKAAAAAAAPPVTEGGKKGKKKE